MSPTVRQQLLQYVKDSAWFMPYIEPEVWEELLFKAIETFNHREQNPDWEGPVVMYGIRRKHRCIKKEEIGLIYDLTPWIKRARTAETHWYNILYRRKVTDKEWEIIKQHESTRRYWVWHYYINPKVSIDKILSEIAFCDEVDYGIDPDPMVKAFESYYGRTIRIYKPEDVTQLSLFKEESYTTVKIEEPVIKNPVNRKKNNWQLRYTAIQNQLDLFPDLSE